MSATQVTPDGTAFAGVQWAEQIVLPTHFKNEDGTQGASIDWSGSTFAVSSNQVTLTHTWDLPSRTVTLSLTGSQVAAQGSSFRWYLIESGQFNAALYWRIVRVDRTR